MNANPEYIGKAGVLRFRARPCRPSWNDNDCWISNRVITQTANSSPQFCDLVLLPPLRLVASTADKLWRISANEVLIDDRGIRRQRLHDRGGAALAVVGSRFAGRHRR